MLVARRLIVTGRVQGVGFRYFTRDAARLDGLRGTVRNLDDDRVVEIEVEGDADAVLRFERTIRRGPGGSRVDDVRVDESPPSGRFHDFRILP
jgi:acylphosphatase